MNTHTNIASTKSALRHKMLALRHSIPQKIATQAAHRIAEQFMGTIPLKKWDVVAGYWAMAGEVNLTLLWEALTEQGHRICLPRIVSKDSPLIFHQWQKNNALHPHPTLKLLEPASTATILTPTILIVPLVAFDAHCMRLGYGGGYYDRTLAALANQPNLLTVGIAFAKQQVAAIPVASHDIALDCVITEKNIILRP